MQLAYFQNNKLAYVTTADIAGFYPSFVKVIPAQTAWPILVRKWLLLFAGCLSKRILDLPKPCNKENILLCWKNFALSLRYCD